MSTITITSNTGSYSANGYLVDNDPWNAGSQVNGVDYTNTITLDPATFPNGVNFSWSWPLADAGAVQAYPHILYTPVNASGQAIDPTVGDLADLSTTYSFSIAGDTKDFSVAWDLWLTTPAGQSDEVMIQVHSPQYPIGSNQPYKFTASSIVNANIFVGNVGWEYVNIQTPADQLNGTLSLSDVFKTLVWDGVLTGNESVSSIQVGAEVQAGAGSLQVNSLSYSLSTNSTLEGTSGDDTFILSNNGGTIVAGNGGTDTAVFSGSYATYQIKESGSQILITNGGNISTLDILEGVQLIDFADGSYNTVIGIFTPNASSAPNVVSLAASGSGITNGSGDLNAGHVVTLTLNMSEAVTVNTTGGTPTLTLNDGATATYTGGSGSSALTFSYTVGAGQNTPDLTVSAVNLNGATIADAAGGTASLSGTFNPTGTLQIDTTTPTVSSVAASGSGISSGNGDLNAGHVVTLTLNMSEAVTVNTTGGTPTLTLNDGATATYTGVSGSSALTFSYTVGAGQNTPDLTVSAVNLNGATIADAAGNTASLSGTFNPTGTLQIDTSTPTVASVTTSGTGISSGNGDLNAGHVVTLTLNMSEAVTVNTTGGTPTLTLNDGATATYTGVSGSSALTFSYTVGAGQNTPDLTMSAVNLNGATIADAAGNNASLSGTFNPTGTLQIDTSTPTVSSVAASGSGISSGNGDLNAGHVVTLTLNMSEAVTVNTTGGTPTLTLNDGATATYTGVSGSSALTFSYTVGAGQNTPDLTVSAVNLNGATIADAAGNNASLSGTFNPTGTLQIDTSTPTVSSVAASGSGISSGNGDLNAGHVVTLTLNMSEAVTVNTTGGTPTLTLNDGATATYTGVSGSSALTFSYTVGAGQNTPDLTITAINSNGATIQDGAGDNANLAGTWSPSGTLQIDTTPPAAPVITGEKVHGNKAILGGAAEASSKITIYEGTVILGTTTASSGGSWTFTTGPLSRGSHTFTATATDAAGNTSVASQPVDPVIAASLPCEINSVYEAALQRAPTDAEVTASLAINSTLGSAGMIAAIVNSAEAITNVYPILQIFNLAFGHFPIAATLASMVDTGLTLPELVAAVVGSQTFANTYNSGTLVNPNSPLTAGSVEAFYNQALGHAPTQATLNEWLNSGLNVAQAFQDLVTSQSYFATTQLAIEQYLTTAANNNAGYANISINSTAADLTPTQIDKIYEAVLQRPPTVTEVTASLALDSPTGDVGVIAALVDSAAAINNVYPILQMFDLAFGHFPGAATLASMVDTDLSVSQLAAAIVASQTFASTYNGGVLINPNSPVTANTVEAFYSEALGHAPTQATLDGWLSGGLTIAQAFEDMVTSQSYFDTTQTSIEQYLTATAINEAGLTTINGALATGSLALGTATVPLTQPGLTVLGGSGGLMVVASGAGDTITELNTSSTDGSITANGPGDTINAANGANTICASGAGDTINLGAVSTGTSITGAQTVHAAGSGDVITFATMAADGTAVTWAASSMVDGGNSSTGIGANSTVNFGNNTGGGSETVVDTGDQTGATTSGGTSTTGITMVTLGNVVDGAGDQIIFNNATTEVLAGASAVNVTAAGSLAKALDLAASAAGNSQSGGMIPANTGVIDWFQYGGNTYLVEAINAAGTASIHPALATTDEVIKIVGLVNLAGESLVGHALTL